MLRLIAEMLTSADDHLRQRALAALLAVTNPDVRRSIVAELVEILREGDAGVCWRATAALVAVGSTAAVTLVMGLVLGGEPAGQVRLAEALRGLAPAVPPHFRAEALLLLEVVVAREKNKAARAAVARALAAVLRHGDGG
jgi:HEAT repeat protein